MKLDFEKFLNDNGLKVGDRIRLKNNNNLVYEITIDADYDFIYLENVETKSVKDIQHLQFDFEKIEPKKKVGEMTCNDHLERFICRDCIFEKLGLNCEQWSANNTFNELKEKFFEKHPLAEPLRPILEQELDKEIKE